MNSTWYQVGSYSTLVQLVRPRSIFVVEALKAKGQGYLITAQSLDHPVSRVDERLNALESCDA